jgi:hypothetical protein
MKTPKQQHCCKDSVKVYGKFQCQWCTVCCVRGQDTRRGNSIITKDDARRKASLNAFLSL